MPTSYTPDSAARLLPRTSSPLERHLLEVEGFDAQATVIGGMATAKHFDIPESFLPWLLQENKLLEFQDFVSDQRTLLEEGKIMNGLKGTPAAIHLAAKWLGFDDVFVREYQQPNLHFPEWWLRLDTPDFITSVDDLCRMARLFKLVQPVRSRFKRVYNSSRDIPKMVWSRSKWGAIYSGVSGIKTDNMDICREARGIVVSLGRSHLVDLADSLFGGTSGYPVNYSLDHHLTHFIPTSIGKPWPVLSQDYPYSFYPSPPVGWEHVSIGEGGEVPADTIVTDDGSHIVTDNDEYLIYT